MRKIVLGTLFFVHLFAFSQTVSDTIVVKIKPTAFKQVALYVAEGAQQKYITHANATDGIFKLAIPKNAPHAAYRLVFNRETMDYIDFLYVGKSFELSFDPNNQNELPKIVNSEENTRFFKFLFKINGIQQQMDSLQIQFFQTNDEQGLATITAQYQTKRDELISVMKELESNEKNPLIKSILYAHNRVLPETPIAEPMEYLSFVKKHFFDHIDFENQSLYHSNVLLDKVMDYVFYLTVAETPEMQNNLYRAAVTVVLDKISNESLRKGFIQALVQSFFQDENVFVIDYIFENYYNKLSVANQNITWKDSIQKELNTAVGRMGSDFEFLLNNKRTKLNDLKGYKYYVIVFWSTTCTHCLQEIPMFYDYIKDRKDVKVITVALESNDSKGNWSKEIMEYQNFINILGMGKWDNPIAQSYNVHATPVYFVLDENKKIIHKPYDFEATELVFEKLK